MAALCGVLLAVAAGLGAADPAATIAFRLPLDPPAIFSYRPQQSAAPVVTPDARHVLVGTASGLLFLVTSDSGKVVYERDLGGGVSAAPVVSGDKVFVGTEEGTVHMLSLCDGKELWDPVPSFKGAVRSKPVLVGEKALVVIDDRSVLHAIDVGRGKLLGSFDEHSFTERGAAPFTRYGYSAPGVDGDEIFAGFEDGHVVRVSVSGAAWGEGAGKDDVRAFDVDWDVGLCGLAELRALSAQRQVCPSTRVFSDVDSSPTPTRHGVLTGCHCRGAVMLDPDSGAVKFEVPLPGPSAPTLATDTAFIAGTGGDVVAIDLKTGRTRWTTRVSISMISTPVLLGTPEDIGGATVVVASGGDLYFLEAAAGTILHSLRAYGGFSDAGAASGRSLFTLSNEGVFYRIDFHR